MAWVQVSHLSQQVNVVRTVLRHRAQLPREEDCTLVQMLRYTVSN